MDRTQTSLAATTSGVRQRSTPINGPDDLGDLYLNRCQVDTPPHLVERVWKHVKGHREDAPALAIDFGAGDGRFAESAFYGRYVGFEIDPERVDHKCLPPNSEVRCACAFSEHIIDADLVVGNPPYVRNQDLPHNWDEAVTRQLVQRTGVQLSGLANAWQYFFLLSLASTKPDGLVVLVIPYEWVSRPSVRCLREYIRRNKWAVHVYRLLDETFHGVMTTSSITVVDKRDHTGAWSYYDEHTDGHFQQLDSPSYSELGVIQYMRLPVSNHVGAYCKRGLSPGNQRALVLTETMRLEHNLTVDIDVVPCITSLKPLRGSGVEISQNLFASLYCSAGLRCWLVNTARDPSPSLRGYLGSVPASDRDTATCAAREEWWRFTMPKAPPLLVATGFTGDRPKIAVNACCALAVGSVSGIYGVSDAQVTPLINHYSTIQLRDRIVPHSNGLRKVEISQMNAVLSEIEAELGLLNGK